MQDAIKSALGSLDTESLLVESVRDMVKDEVKSYLRQKIDENPELKTEIREAVRDLMDAKIREAVAMVRLAKCGAELGLASVPADMRQKLGNDMASLFERELTQLLDKV
jgi:hypothetical protein